MTVQAGSVEELAFRESDGITVSLLWVRDSNRARVVVEDHKLGAGFALDIDPCESPLDVFNHPYAYAACEPNLLASSR